MKAVIIDDERLARTELKHLLEQHTDTIDVIGEAVNAKEGIEAIEKQKVLMFMNEFLIKVFINNNHFINKIIKMI